MECTLEYKFEYTTLNRMNCRIILLNGHFTVKVETLYSNFS